MKYRHKNWPLEVEIWNEKVINVMRKPENDYRWQAGAKIRWEPILNGVQPLSHEDMTYFIPIE